MFLVKYTGPFGFIKPWTAVRDSETYSQQFLAESTIAGIEQKLFPDLLKLKYSIYKIIRYRLSYSQISQQQEQIQPRGWNERGGKQKKYYERPFAILVRGVLLNPVLYLGFDKIEDAQIASIQHICLARNEDILLPDEKIIEVTEDDFDNDTGMYSGFELIFEKKDKSFLVGYNRLNKNKPMYGWLKIVGNPVKNVI